MSRMAGELSNLQRGCERAREWVSLRADGELSELERLLLRRHLARCAECRGFAESIGTVTEVLRTTPQERPSRALEPAQPRIREHRRRVRLRVAAVAAGLATAGVVAGVLVASESGGESPVPRPAGTTIVQLPEAPPTIPSRPPQGANV